jgi:hypothetical protein
MNLESRQVSTSQSQEELYDFLTQVENFEQLMPENTTFEVKGSNTFIFGLKGMPEIKLGLQESTPHSKIVLGSTSDNLPFTLSCEIIAQETGALAQLHFTGDFNAMMAMMIKGPISKFLEQLANGLEKI